jgi:hypothetical protein
MSPFGGIAVKTKMRHCCAMTDEVHFRLRIPTSLHQKLAELAEQNHRSINSEVIARLRGSIASDAWTPEQMTNAIKYLQERVDGLQREMMFLSMVQGSGTEPVNEDD